MSATIVGARKYPDRLAAGHLPELSDDIERMRAEAKARKGWVMDTYLLRKARCLSGNH
jgi:hypothetical protein